MSEQRDEVLLRVEHLCQYFGSTRAVDDVSFDIRKGEVFGLVGESGSGKTTTARSIIRLYDITSGSIYFKGRRIAAGTLSCEQAIRQAQEEMKTASPARRAELKALIGKQRELIKAARHDHFRCDSLYAGEMAAKVKQGYKPLLARAQGEKAAQLKKEYAHALRVAKKQRFTTQIQMIFQDPIASLDPRKTVYETVAEGLEIRGEKDKRVIDKKVFRVLDMVGLLREHAGRYPHEFSGGQRQRIGMARAVVVNPEMIIADEPVSALDVSVQAQVINLLDDLRRELNLTILFIAHDLSVVRYFSDRIGVMYCGKMVELAASDELFARPLHPYTRSLLSSIPLPDPLYERQRVRRYDPLSAHDYSTQKPAMREITPGHFVLCSDAEFDAYRRDVSHG